MFINHEAIGTILHNAQNTPQEKLTSILEKAKKAQGLTLEETAALLTCDNQEILNQCYKIAGQVKNQIYGNRVVMFAPLYVSNYCVNRCVYCSYNHENEFTRRRLTMQEVVKEVQVLQDMGHKRIALEAGEDGRNCPIEYIEECIETIYKTHFSNGAIRRINVNIAATSVENYKRLKKADIGTYILFQETYHQPTYEAMHPAGPKSKYEYHLTAFDRAMQGGLEDVGGGVLFGLADPYFEVLGLLMHNQHLEENYGAGFHTISVPRLQPAKGMDIGRFPHLVNDNTFKKIVAILRLAVPYTGIILSTRENSAMRKTVLELGVSQLSAGSSTQVGGYSEAQQGTPQFDVREHSTAFSIINGLLQQGYLPSFCTACYKVGRTGDRFMRLAKSGQIKNVCLPNALLTLAEYAMDYGDASFKKSTMQAINNWVNDIESPEMQENTRQNLEKIKAGGRNYFV